MRLEAGEFTDKRVEETPEKANGNKSSQGMETDQGRRRIEANSKLEGRAVMEVDGEEVVLRRTEAASLRRPISLARYLQIV